MDFVAEDGTGRADATSYATIAALDDYHAAMGATAWAALNEPAKQIAAMRATQYIDAMYRARQGPLVEGQALQFPVKDQKTWPLRNLTAATAELALKASAEPLVNDPERLRSSVSVGPVKIGYEPGGAAKRYPLVDALLRDLVFALGQTRRVVRGS